MGRWGILVNAVAVAWGLFMAVDIGWPRAEVYDPAWFAIALLAAVLIAGGLLFARTRKVDAESTVVEGDTLHEITSIDELTTLVGEPIRRVAEKVRPTLHELDRQWLAASPFCLIGTSDVEGNCDVSPKGDPPGFTLVLDERTIAVPDRLGNRRVDGWRNIIVNPHVGLLYLVPGRGDTLRINGRARLLSDAPFFDDMIVKGHRPKIVMLVEIDEVFAHCAKAFMRSQLWNPETWDPESVASRPVIAKALEASEVPLSELEQYYGPAYANGLY